MAKQIILIALLIAAAQAEFFNRPCRTVEQYGGVKLNFRPLDFLGEWFEIERYEQPWQRGLHCTKAIYTLLGNGSIEVFNQAQNLDTMEVSADVGMAEIAFPDEDPLQGKLNVTFGGLDEVIGTTRANYWILDTDYKDFAVVVSCANLPAGRSFESYWLISRTTKASPNARAVADDIKRRVLDPSRVIQTKQPAVCFHGQGSGPIPTA